jgi:DNA-binding winged helix-turn-helix (wHTH) protein
VHLTGKEYQMLELLSLRKGTTLTKEMFLNHLYGGMDEPELKIIDVFICKLRKKLAQATEGDNYIETVWGRGYVLRDPERQAEQRLAAPERLTGSIEQSPLDLPPRRSYHFGSQARRDPWAETGGPRAGRRSTRITSTGI